MCLNVNFYKQTCYNWKKIFIILNFKCQRAYPFRLLLKHQVCWLSNKVVSCFNVFYVVNFVKMFYFTSSSILCGKVWETIHWRFLIRKETFFKQGQLPIVSLQKIKLNYYWSLIEIYFVSIGQWFLYYQVI